MDALAEFVLARLEEQLVSVTLGRFHASECEWLPQLGSEYTYPCECGVPEGMKADAETKRRIVELHSGNHECSSYDHTGQIDNCAWILDGDCSTMQLLALPYADHPDWREEWRPTTTN